MNPASSPHRSLSTASGSHPARARSLAAITSACAIVLCAALSPEGAALASEGRDAPARLESGHAILASSKLPHIIVLKQAPLALYRGGLASFDPLPRVDGRLDMASSEADAYLDHVRQAQTEALGAFERTLGRNIDASLRFQHAINAMVVQLGTDEALALARDPRVALVEAYREYPLDSYRGPEFVGATAVWAGTANPELDATRGENRIIGVIDSGINFLSNGFAATDVDGYVHVNPLDRFLGTCAPGAIDDAPNRCSGKIIGAYDFVYANVCTPATPASDPCRDPAAGGTIREEPSAIDTNGHGSHTASIAAGTRHTVNGGALGVLTLSGIAPRAHIIAYDACFTQGGQGLCPNIATVASINQAVADGIVDAINYSIGGGAQPWGEATSLALLAAHDAGIFVATSAGNSGPGPATVGHLEPWVTASAAATHDRNTSGAPATGDVMASFSSRGPSPYAVLKPDITAPGVSILAAFAGANPAPTSYSFVSGTSMASPHVAGAALLMRSLHPTWTPMQIKSALMGTTKRDNLLKENGTTPADPHDRGAGRLQADVATRVGLILDESGANFAAANPATGGDPSQLNLASYYDPACVGTCTFRRSIRSTAGVVTTWTVDVTGLPAGAYTAPSSLLVGSASNTSFELAIDSTQLPPGQFVFGEVNLTSSIAGVPVASFPIGIRAELPILATDVDAIAVSLTANTSATRSVVVSNEGNPTLDYDPAPATALATLVDRNAHPAGQGIASSFATTTPANTGAYATDDFDNPTDGSVLSRIEVAGFTSGNISLATLASSITWRVWRDEGGLPDGKPESSDVPVFSFTTPPNSPGVSVVGGRIVLNIAAAGAPMPTLPAGKYWLMVSPHVANIGARWSWSASGDIDDLELAQFITPGAAFDNVTANQYVAVSGAQVTGAPVFDSLAMRVQANVVCGASWMTTLDDGGELGLGESSTVRFEVDSSGLAPGDYSANFCVASGGTSVNPVDRVIPVRLTVIGAAQVDIFGDGFEVP